MSDRAWLERRIAESPDPLRAGLQARLDGLAPDAELSSALVEAACEILDSVRHRLEQRAAAYDLLVADGLLTLACEAVARTEPETVAERCRDLGPGARLGELAAEWAAGN